MYSLMDQTFSIRCMRLRDWELYRGIYLFPFTNVLRDCYNISTKKMLYISNKKINKNTERERENFFLVSQSIICTNFLAERIYFSASWYVIQDKKLPSNFVRNKEIYLHLLHNHKRVEEEGKRETTRENSRKISKIFHDRVTIYRTHPIGAKNREGIAACSEGSLGWNPWPHNPLSTTLWRYCTDAKEGGCKGSR